ncbi:hypothetical protein PsYK624_115980 [Phanerochaete sordida]|uniref:DUF6535 domain-containing protein n=1 Tax=Phanerochaete sordida TaxID=48140 RepID=A0A9P3GJI6_9APHY|nr:hypothetical protein PsYK624_115980 [Phanerochaete sordida]
MNRDSIDTDNSARTAQATIPGLWGTMFHAVTKVDKQKVDDVKEDIDTLLVFVSIDGIDVLWCLHVTQIQAGLFSAVVTTFVVASYPNLQPDNTDEIVFLLRQTLAQNYTFADGVLRPMSPFPDDPPFEVPLWALRVNALWFASLIVSLSTASFGMLVKQWLIEYLAMEQWSSPQEQLRARHYRNPGLHHWKVFEIAGILPLFLHISLGLFFVGLGFYTAAANETVGRSTYILVSGWAFSALLTVFAPLASPRCPYKLASVKAAMRIGRRYITSHFWKPGRAMIDGAAIAARWFWKDIIGLPYKLGSAFMNRLSNLRQAAKEISRILWLSLCVLSLPLLLLQGTMSCLLRLAVYMTSDHGTDVLEEEDIMRMPYQIHELLLIADEVLIDDSEILEGMAELLQRSGIDPRFITAFSLGCIRNRMSIASNRDRWIPGIQSPIRGLLDLRVLSDSAWSILAKLMGEILKTEMLKSTLEGAAFTTGPRADDHWMTNAAAVLLSNSQWPFPEHVHQLLTDDASLAKVLQLVRNLLTEWPMRDVLHVVWIAVTASDRKPGVPARRLEKKWTRLPTANKQEHTLTHLQVVVVQIILENVWRNAEGRIKDTIEAISMLCHILGASLPVRNIWREHGMQQSQSSLGLSEPDFEDNSSQLTEYFGIADYLVVIVGASRKLLESALMLYSSYFYQSLPRVDDYHESLWADIHQTSDIEDLWWEDTARRAIMLDLWRFLLKCARIASESHDGSDYLQTDEFIKLCLALAQPNVPRVFGRPNPADDWEELVPVLSRTAERRSMERLFLHSRVTPLSG